MGIYTNQAKQLLRKLTLREKVAQLSQTIDGYRCFDRQGEQFELSDELKDFVRNFGAFGALSNILRADPFTHHSYGTGIEPRHRAKIANQIQRYVLENSRVPIPVLIEVEANHGVHAVGSEMYPTNLGMGCMFNPELYGKVMKCVGKEIRLSGNQMGFVTMLDMARDPRWGRTEEFFSEDPYLAALYVENGVKQMKTENVLVCCKHYCATGDGLGGLNAAEVNIGHRELFDIHFPSVIKAVNAGADVFMAAYNSVDGIPCHANEYLLRDILRNRFGFDGIILSDGFAIQRLTEQMGLNMQQGASLALKSGVDISLADRGCYLNLIEACENGLVNETVIDQAVLRVLEKKFELGLFEHPYIEEDASLEKFFSSGISQKLSYESACESIVMLKNNGILPLSPKTKIALFGIHADNMYYQLGSYTAFRSKKEMKSIRDALSEKFLQCEFTEGWDFYGKDNDFDNAINILNNSDVAVVTVGGNSSGLVGDTTYSQKNGAVIASKTFCDCGEGRDVASLQLPGNQVEFIERLSKCGKPIIVIEISGRPYEINKVNEIADAVLTAWYPGQRGADAIADVLTGKVNPSGKLSVSIPTSAECLPVYYNRIGVIHDGERNNDHSINYCDKTKRVLYPFGYGLSYSNFVYENIDAARLSKNSYKITVKVKNDSSVPGKEAIQLYIRGSGNTIRRRGLELKGIKKLWFEPYETKEISFYLGFEELKIFNTKEEYVVEPGRVQIFVGSNPNLPLTTEIVTE